jgi:IclR family transcriptional regulator, acetate operon repressor
VELSSFRIAITEGCGANLLAPLAFSVDRAKLMARKASSEAKGRKQPSRKVARRKFKIGRSGCRRERQSMSFEGSDTTEKRGVLRRALVKRGNVQALTRAISILRATAESGEGLTLTEIARATGLAPSTAHRLLTTLQQDRFVQFEPQGGRWTIGVGAFAIGNAFLSARDIVRCARPLLRRLVDKSGETANLAVLDEDMAVYLGQVANREFVRAICKPGGRTFLHSSSLGKSMLALMRPEDVYRILATKGMARFTEKTIDSIGRMTNDLAGVRTLGYAVDDEEYSLGLRCVAAAITNEHGEPIGAVSISGPTMRVARERIPQLGALVRSIADELTRELGGRSVH